MNRIYIKGDEPEASPETSVATPTPASVEHDVVSVERYVRGADERVKHLSSFGERTPEVLDEIEAIILDLAPKNDGHNLAISMVIDYGLGTIVCEDTARALRVAEMAIDQTPASSPAEKMLIAAWERMALSHTEQGRAEIYHLASKIFTDTARQGLKASAAAKVSTLSIEAARQPEADLHGIKRILSLVADFARSHDPALLGVTSSNMAFVDHKITFSGPAYGQR